MPFGIGGSPRSCRPVGVLRSGLVSKVDRLRGFAWGALGWLTAGLNELRVLLVLLLRGGGWRRRLASFVPDLRDGLRDHLIEFEFSHV